MLNQNSKLSQNLFSNPELLPTRQGYGEGLVIAGEADPNVVVMCADLTESTKSDMFKKKFPERFIEAGVAEQLLATAGAGLAAYGKIPFISSYAAFSPGRNWEQIRTTICLNDVPVKIAGAHAGLTVGPDGATHQMLEDMAIMRALPNMIVINPCDAIEAKKATVAAAQNGKPTYLRFAREKSAVMTTEETPFEIGKAYEIWNTEENSKSEYRNSKQILNSKFQIPNEVAIIGCGPLLYEAILAAKELEENGIGAIVLNMHTIKPLDTDAVLKVARQTGAIVTVEEHQITGGLGGAVAEFLAKSLPTPMEFIGMPDHFGESGQPDELLTKYKMKAKDIVLASHKVIARKNS